MICGYCGRNNHSGALYCGENETWGCGASLIDEEIGEEYTDYVESSVVDMLVHCNQVGKQEDEIESQESDPEPTGACRIIQINDKWFWCVHTGSGTYKYLEISESS